MRPARILTVVVAIAVVVGAAVLAKGGGSKDPGKQQAAQSAKGALTLSFVVSPEKEALLKPLVAQFNASGAQAAGKRVFVAMRAQNSGDTENALRKATGQPDVWSPAGSFWGRLL